MIPKSKIRSYDRELDLSLAARLGAILVDVFDPLFVLIETIGTDADDLDVSFLKVFSSPGDLTELCCADWREIVWMREQDAPRIAEPFVEVDLAQRRLCSEVGSDGTKTQGRTI